MGARAIQSSTRPEPSADRPFVAGQIPSLDGLRAMSILLVLLCHVANTAGSPLIAHASWYQKTAVGVDVFFVISGFLITTLLMREQANTGSVSLTGFWKRRALRILPAFLVYLGTLFVLNQFGIVHFVARDWVAATTYTVNFMAPVTFPVMHFWSLSVEEHFYILWPIIFVIAGAMRSAKLVAIALLAEPVIRWCTYTFARGTFDIDFVTFTRYDAIGVGCLMAIVAQMPASAPALRTMLARIEARPIVSFAAGFVTLALSVYVFAFVGKYKIFFFPLVNAGAIAVMVWSVIRCPQTPLGRFLNLSPVMWLGRLSYSLYLWQQLFLDASNSARWFCRFPQNLICSFAAALASYYLVERPMLALRKRARKETTDTQPVPLVGEVSRIAA